tara:strand:+ start:1132 stop:2253 length:1122 start_codon:yes stop_codon:yes gene_type:complete
MASKKIGITGHNGFLGNHIKNIVNYKFQDYQIVHFDRIFFKEKEALSNFVNSCDIIIHLAGLNRHSKQEEIIKINVQLAKTLSKSLISNNFKGSLIYSSSVKIYHDSPYGKSKKQAGEILAKAASYCGFSFFNLILPNIFGPFGKPNYNSFIATFSDQLIHGETPKIIKDEKVPLIYVESVVYHFLNQIDKEGIHTIDIPQETEKKVSDVLVQLKEFNYTYIERGSIPKLRNLFEIQLFNSFRSAIDESKFFPKQHMLHVDERGYFSELVRSYSKSQCSYSVTKSGVTRGDHFHTRKIERFSVIQGEATIQMRKIGTDKLIEFKINGEEPSYVDMPVWTTHNITNTGKEDLITIFWINEHYNSEDADIYFEKV